MSTTVLSHGFIAQLSTEMNEEEMEELSETFYDNNSALQISYDGTLIFVDYNSLNDYSARECYEFLSVNNHVNNKQQFVVEDFIDRISKYGIKVTGEIKPYTCIWYNGADCPVSCMSVEDFLKY